MSELHALSAEGFVKFAPDKSEVKLCPFEGFLAKNQRPDEPPREFIIKALRHHTPTGDPERLLCPVRALRLYLEKTNTYRGKRKKLFLSLVKGRNSKEISVHAISRWI